MLRKAINIFKLLTSPALYKTVVRGFIHYYYEHSAPLAAAQKGKNVSVHPTVNLRFGENIILGDNVVIESNCCLWASENSKIKFGANSGMSFGSMVVSSNHGFYEPKSYRDQGLMEKDVIVENDVWIGANCTILYGVTIGEFSIIGAGTVVSKSIPPYSVVVGKNRELMILPRKSN